MFYAVYTTIKDILVLLLLLLLYCNSPTGESIILYLINERTWENYLIYFLGC